MDIEVRPLRQNELDKFVDLIALFNQVFEIDGPAPPNKPYLQSVLQNPNFLVFAAISEERVIGGLTAYILPSYYNSSAELYIYDLAVKASHQRKGYGREIMSAVKEYCKTNNLQTFFVQADEGDEHAIEFSRAIGGQEARVRHFSFLG